MIRAFSVICDFSKPDAATTLDETARHRRRMGMTSEHLENSIVLLVRILRS